MKSVSRINSKIFFPIATLNYKTQLNFGSSFLRFWSHECLDQNYLDTCERCRPRGPPQTLWLEIPGNSAEILYILFAPNMISGASQVVIVVKNLPSSPGDIRNKALIPGLGRSPREETATYSSVLAWRIHAQRSLLGYTAHRVTQSRTWLKQLSFIKRISKLTDI